MASAISTRTAARPGLEVRLSALSGGPRSIVDKSGALTGPAPGRGSEAIVRDYVRQNADLFGMSEADLADLVVLGDSAGGTSGLRMLRIEQQIDGRPIFQSETRFLLDREGRLVKGAGLLIPNARASWAAAGAPLFMAPAQALSRLLAAEGRTVDPAAYTVAPGSGGRQLLSGGDGHTVGPVTARQVLFPLAPGLLVPAWSLVAFTSGEQDWYAVVDAQTGDLLWRKGIRENASAHDARFRVYVQADGFTPADSPAPQSPNAAAPGAGTQFPEIALSIVSMHAAMLAVDPTGTASPNGWIDDCPGGACTANETQTLGNNVLVCLDRTVGVSPSFVDRNICDTDAGGVLDGNGRPTGNPDSNGRNRDFLGTTPRDFQTGYLPPPQAGNPETGQTTTGAGASGTAPIDQFRRGALTQLFYLSNWYHDKLFRLGFDEASANFQQSNLSGFGVGGDRVLADAQDGSSTNNANFSTPPDGVSGRMQMFRFTGPTTDRDGGLDADVVLHELTHGTSNRLVGNGAGLNWDPARGLGEGWSDFYALSLLNGTNGDNPNARYATGAYATYKLGGNLDNYVYGIRRFPYSTDHSVNPMTWADVDDVTNDLSGGIAPSPLGSNINGGMQVHNIGEIWALTLWGVRARVIADPAGANGDVPTGNHTMLQLVTDALKMTPIDPSFIEARDAIVDADCATNACANEGSIWAGFADRGLGYGAAAPFRTVGGYVRSHMAIRESFAVPFLEVANPATDITIDDGASNNNGAIDPGEAVRINVKLTNPWRASGKAVTGVNATLTTTTPGITVYDDTAAYGAIAPQGTATGDGFTFTVSPSLAAGAPIDFTLATVSNLGSTSTTFRLRVGTRNGTDPAVTYTGTPGLAITSNQPRGVFHPLNVADDLEIADVNFRIDSIATPAAGELTAMLRSPGGIGVDLISLIDGFNDWGGTSIVNMVIDDDVAAVAANDMVQATVAAAPYSKSWLPVFASPWAALVNPAMPAEPVGHLAPHIGASTKGTWTAHVSDVSTNTSGSSTLGAWSLIVTPARFEVTAFVAAADVSGTKTVAGTFAAGQTVTYTVTLTNNGTANQADNPGNEFTDTLPSSLALVAASASAGTAVATTGTNTVTWNGSLAPLGGSATITITATINPGTPGGTLVSNQGTIQFDADASGSNETPRSTDDPAVGGSADPTMFTVAGAAPAIDLSPDSLAFASRLVGSPSPAKTVTVANAGAANLSLSAITVTGANAADFATGGTCTGATVLAPAEACSIDVTFTPGGLGERSASLDILSNDPANPTRSASLGGTGVATAPLFRSYLSPSGNDANPCTLPAPCRLLPAALAVVADGGEVWMLGSANFNVATVTVDKSVTILAVPGALGSIVANNGDALVIAGPDIAVTLRNLVILNLSGASNTAIKFNQGAQLTVGGCEIYGVAQGILAAATGGFLVVKETTIRDIANTGVYAQASVFVTLDAVALLNNGFMGLFVSGGAQAQVANSTISGSIMAAMTQASGGATARLALSETTLSGNGTAVAVSANPGEGTAQAVLDNVTITHNGTGVTLGGTGTRTVFTRQNSTFRYNGTDVSNGPLTPQGAF